MNRKYSISYFILLTSVALAFVLAYSMSSRSYKTEDSTADEFNLIIDEYVDGEVTSEIDTAEDETDGSDEEVTDGYYIYNDGGYVSVLLHDKMTLFERTEIEVNTLDPTLQEELEHGKYINTIEELYGFLENYSS